MKTLNLIGNDLLLENTVYEYKNDFYTYTLKLIPEVEIRSKYEIHCSQRDLVPTLQQELDTWLQPESYDLLELTACIYDMSITLGKIFFLSSYVIEISIKDMHDITKQSDDLLVLPDFQVDEKLNSGRIIKGFKDFR